MKARIALLVILTVLLSACGGSATQTPASAPVTQATMDAARDANATIIAASIPTAAPTVPSKPTTATSATARVGTTATATTAPTRSAGASSTSLSQTLQGPQGCVVIRYPSDWTVDKDSGLAKGNTDHCPGGTSVKGTTRDRSCDDNSYEEIAQIYGPFVETDTGIPPLVHLGFVAATCNDLSGLIKYVQSRGTDQGSEFTQTIYGPVRPQTIAGFPAQCFDGTSTDKKVTPVRGSLCFFSVAGDLFALGWGAEESYWQQSPSVLNSIVASLELHPL